MPERSLTAICEDCNQEWKGTLSWDWDQRGTTDFDQESYLAQQAKLHHDSVFDNGGHNKIDLIQETETSRLWVGHLIVSKGCNVLGHISKKLID